MPRPVPSTGASSSSPALGSDLVLAVAEEGEVVVVRATAAEPSRPRAPPPGREAASARARRSSSCTSARIACQSSTAARDVAEHALEVGAELLERLGVRDAVDLDVDQRLRLCRPRRATSSRRPSSSRRRRMIGRATRCMRDCRAASPPSSPSRRGTACPRSRSRRPCAAIASRAPRCRGCRRAPSARPDGGRARAASARSPRRRGRGRCARRGRREPRSRSTRARNARRRPPGRPRAARERARPHSRAVPPLCQQGSWSLVAHKQYDPSPPYPGRTAVDSAHA